MATPLIFVVFQVVAGNRYDIPLLVSYQKDVTSLTLIADLDQLQLCLSYATDLTAKYSGKKLKNSWPYGSNVPYLDLPTKIFEFVASNLH